MINLKRIFCKHDLVSKGSEIMGATMGWSFTPTRSYRFKHECSKCGYMKLEDGMVIFGDKKIYPKYYNERGWPIDDDGNELEIYDSRK